VTRETCRFACPPNDQLAERLPHAKRIVVRASIGETPMPAALVAAKLQVAFSNGLCEHPAQAAEAPNPGDHLT
jgi:hypothetical protein